MDVKQKRMLNVNNGMLSFYSVNLRGCKPTLF